MHIYLVRHGETLQNVKGAYYGAMDPPLTQTGIEQARRLGGYLQEICWNKIYISNKIRARETAEIIAGNSFKEAWVRLDALSELDFGQWEGMTNAQVQAQFSEDYTRWCQDWKTVAPTGGETFNHFFQRVKRAFESILDDCKNEAHKNILICAHNGTLRVIFAVICGLDEEGTWHFNFEQDAYSKVDYEYGNFTIRSINRR